ncbi:MAG: pyrroline-5-carboxylate reductase [Burkholderiaceae bacterium]|nr:MAG: pyrroline-5-carboxylate reductase [Burkholderiaceae bacterium]
MNATSPLIAFIGGGNMATAIFAGLIRHGHDPRQILVLEPRAEQREWLTSTHGVRTLAGASPELAAAAWVVWAVKPQQFADAAAPLAALLAEALHLSVMAGVRLQALQDATGTQRWVRAMPNTPALIGQGVTGLHAGEALSHAERQEAQALLAPTGQVMWVQAERDLDAVTALSGSGPAYVFYLLEAMMQAGTDMGLSPEQARTLALGTVQGAAALAAQSDESPALLRERVTSKGGTTHAALSHMDAHEVKRHVHDAILAAQARAAELGRG